jgi:hypothetical protein
MYLSLSLYRSICSQFVVCLPLTLSRTQPVVEQHAVNMRNVLRLAVIAIKNVRVVQQLG